VSPQRERLALIPRRALFDVRMQLMAEADDFGGEAAADAASNTAKGGRGGGGAAAAAAAAAATAAALGDSDIEQDVYEGGFKSWEGALDLARLLLERGPRKDIDELARVDSVVEVRFSQPCLVPLIFRTPCRSVVCSADCGAPRHEANSSAAAPPSHPSCSSSTPSRRSSASTSRCATTTPRCCAS